jgi:hypothetical protein
MNIYDKFSFYLPSDNLYTSRFYINFRSYKTLACGGASRTVQLPCSAGEFRRDNSLLDDAKTEKEVHICVSCDYIHEF